MAGTTSFTSPPGRRHLRSSRRADSARLFALGFGAVDSVVTIWGFVDGNDVLALIPVDAAETCCTSIARSASAPAALFLGGPPQRAGRHLSDDVDPRGEHDDDNLRVAPDCCTSCARNRHPTAEVGRRSIVADVR